MMRSTLSTLTKQTMGRVRRRTSTKQRSMTLVVRNFLHRTSGRDWNRTRKMGVNTLAFRPPPHRTFFPADPDCVPVTKDVPWKMTQQWLDLVTWSGATLIVSTDPSTVTSEEKRSLKAALAVASRWQPEAEPLDWMETTSPGRWRFEDKVSSFDWFGEEGADAFSR